MEVLAGETHYMIIPYATTGLPRSGWTVKLFRNGALAPEIDIQVRESTSGYYTFTFTNDGVDKTHWQLIVRPVAVPQDVFWDTWMVRKNITQQQVSTLTAENAVANKRRVW